MAHTSPFHGLSSAFLSLALRSLSRPLLEKPRAQPHKELQLSGLVSQGMSKGRAEGERGGGVSPGSFPGDSCAGSQGGLLALTYPASVPGHLMTVLSEGTYHVLYQTTSARRSPGFPCVPLLPFPTSVLHRSYSTHPHLYVPRAPVSWSQATTVVPVDDPKRGTASASGDFSSRGLFPSLLGPALGDEGAVSSFGDSGR